MINLLNDQLILNFPHISEEAGLSINFQRTLRIPDDGREYHLPPGLGRFPLRHIEDYDLGESEHRKSRGGIILPMFQADAMWMSFQNTGYRRPSLPVALKIGAGKINAVSGLKWQDGLSQEPQNYMVAPNQPWLDGFNVAKDVIRQFVAMPLGQGYSVEEQVDPDSDVGGIQIEAIPMKKERYEELVEKKKRAAQNTAFSRMPTSYSDDVVCRSASMEIGLGMGGSMRQKIYEDAYGLDAWDIENRQRCFVMLANAQQWMSLTGEEPPLRPISADQYSKAGLPWFDYFDADKKAIDGAKALGKIKSVKELAEDKSDDVWPDEPSPKNYVTKKLSAFKVSDGKW